MADYQGLIKVGIQGLGEIRQLNAALERTSQLYDNLENAQLNVGQVAQSATRNVNRAAQRRAQAGRDLSSAGRTVANVAMRRDSETGRFVGGGANATARRLANSQLRLAQRDVRESDRNLREEIQNRRLVAAAERRYAKALNRTSDIRENIQRRGVDAATQIASASNSIGQASRGNYLTNLYQGRQREFARGGAGMGLSPELQQQARNVRGAWDLATAGGRENLQLMQRIATEMAGLLRQQNELNRGRTGRSTGFETGRRGQERITALSAMPGADPARIRRLRSQATDVISASNTGDIAGSREATLRMNASIDRYTRELNAAAAKIRNAPSSRIPQGPLEIASRARALRESGGQLALPSSNMLAERVARAAGGVAPVDLLAARKERETQLNEQRKQQQEAGKRLNNKQRQEDKRQAGLGIGVSAPQRIGGPTRRVSAVPMGGGIDSGIMPRALPSDKLLERRVASSGQIQPSRLDELQAAQQKQLAKEAERAAGSLGRFGAAVEREEKRRQSQGIGVPGRTGGSTKKGGAIPMGGQGGRPGMFNQYSSLAGPGNPVGIEQFKAEQKRQQGQKGFFQGSARKAIGEGLIGGAFPLLFGQGIGASLGGAAGGATGGMVGGSFGFGLSLAGTAIGQVVDTTAKNLTELATALKTPDDTLQALAKSGFYVSHSLEFQVKQLESVGRAYDAQTLVLQEVEKRLGSGSVRQLNALESEQRRLQEQWSSIAGTLQSELLPALVGFTGVIADTINVARGIGSLPGAKQVGTVLTNGLIGPSGAILTALQRRGKAVAAGQAGNRQAAKAQDEFAAGTTQIQESRKIADQIQSAYREAFSLQREAYDLQRNGAILNRDTADYSYKKEREIFDLRQQAAEKQIENNRSRAQNRIEGSDLNARQTFAAATGFEQQLLGNVREAVRSRKEGEADIEQSRNRLELAMAKLNRDTEDYKRTNAREIEDIEQRKLSYVRSVEDYKMKVADYVRDRSREAADLMRQAMTLPDMGAAAGGGGGSIGGSKLSRLIGGAESYGGNYGAFNRGGTNNGHYSIDPGKDPSLVNMTIAEIQRRQLAPGVPRSQQLHAVGKYQIIGDTMQSLMRGRYGPTGVSPSDRFTPDVQEKLGSALARNRVMGKTVDEGMRGLRQEWIGLQNVSDAKLRDAVIELQKTGNLQGQTATQISNIPGPKFSPTPIGPTPSIAPMNAANMAARLQLAGGEKEALKILEEQNKLKQKGIELGQIEQILQGNQLPQLKQQEDTLKQQITARQKILDLSDNAASVADIEAESRARLKQIDIDRNSALAKAKKQYGNDPATIKQINEQANLAVGIAKKEEEQRRKNLDLNNKLQNQEQSRSAILQLQETLATGKAEAAALERGKLAATNVELLKASELYNRASDDEKARLALLTAQTEELGKQNDFRRQINEVRNDTRFTGAGLRAGMIGAPARAYEQGLKNFEGDTVKAMAYAKENKLLEDQQMIWGNLEKNIVDVSNAISGALTNGLVDIVDGSRKIQDVGRDMLKAMAGTFADSAQQQLTTLMQRQLGSMLGGPLAKALGGSATAAGPQAMNTSSMAAAGSLNGLNAAAIALQATFQAMAAQGAFSSSTGGLGAALSGSMGNIGSAFSVANPSLFAGAFSGGATGGLGAALSGSLGNIGAGFSVPTAFGGFLAGGGTTKPGKGYVVGENGPEFFFPGASGRVVPNSARQKADSMQRDKADPIDIRYTVTEQRGERYVTEEQFRKGMSSSSKRAQAMTYAGMRNNKEIRDFVDI